MSRRFRLMGLLAASVFAVGMVACGGGDDGGAEDTDTGGGGSESSASTEVAVALGEFSIVPNPTSAAAGEVVFNVTNNGAIPHEFVVIKGSDAAALPTAATGADLSGSEEVGRIDQFNSGEEKTLTVDLEAGDYILICNIPGHFAGGMHTEFTVE